MKTILRHLLVNMVALWVAAQAIPGVVYSGGFKTLLLGSVAFAAINFLLVPLIRILLLPLNLLTLGLFAWLTNVLALYALTTVVPDFRLIPYHFPGFTYDGFIFPPLDLTQFWVAVIASFLIGIISHFLLWLSH